MSFNGLGGSFDPFFDVFNGLEDDPIIIIINGFRRCRRRRPRFICRCRCRRL
jgi:hypothetical protein